MKANTEKYKIELIVRTTDEIAKDKRKLSIEYKKRDKIDRQKEKQGTLNKFISQPTNTPLQTQKSFLAQTLGKRQQQYRQFTDKCINFLTKKKSIFSPPENKTTTNSFHTMMNNIKFAYKQQKRQKQIRSEQNHYKPERPHTSNHSQLSVAKSQIHQAYNHEDRIELYKIIRSTQIKGSLKKQLYSKMQKPDSMGVRMNERCLRNPFLNLNTVVCYSLAIQQPQNHKKLLFQAPVYRQKSIPTSQSSRKIQISRPGTPKFLVFHMNSDHDNQYMKKLKSFLDFLYKINYSNNIYVPFEFAPKEQSTPITKYKMHIGKGNNSLLIKSLIKRRFWWEIVQQPDADVNFYWSQNKIDNIHTKQSKTEVKQQQFEKICKKERHLEESYLLNRKILPSHKSIQVEKYIFKDGYSLPFEDIYQAKLVTNHLPVNNTIGSKKNLFKSLYAYYTNIKKVDPFNYIPKTYHLKGTQDPQYKQFIQENQQDPSKVWIVKPGEQTNRGNGIQLCTFSSISNLLRTKRKHENGQPLTYIIQSYLHKPFLYHNRKFDLRHYFLLTSVNNQLKAYWYKEGYVRTSSQIYELEDLQNMFIHLTNDAIQKQSQNYEAYQPANKVSYSQFQRYLDYNHPNKNYNLEKDILAPMKQAIVDVIKANYLVIDPHRKASNFEIFGLDIMIDKDFKPWLIEINYNPCLQINCNLLNRVIPSMVQNSFRIALDPLFPPKCHFPISKRFNLSDHYLKNLRYELIFDEGSLTTPISNQYDLSDQNQEQQQYVDEGKQIDELVI